MRWPTCSNVSLMVAPATERLRVFFALWPDAALRAQLVTATAQAVSGAPGRAVPAANLHVTLAFLHSVEAALLPALLEVGEQLPLPRLTLALDCWGYFARPRVLWLGPAQVPADLTRFEQQLWQALEPLGFAREHAQFRPHVTLARKAAGIPALPPPRIDWPVRRWALVRSRPHSAGSVYTPLAEWPARD
jgi:2'-5' RNA ligase